MNRLLILIWEMKWYWLAPLVVTLVLVVLWILFFSGDVNSVFNYQAF